MLKYVKPPPKDKQDLNSSREASSHVFFLFQRKSPFLEIAPISPPHRKKVHVVSMDLDVPH